MNDEHMIEIEQKASKNSNKIIHKEISFEKKFLCKTKYKEFGSKIEKFTEVKRK